MSDRAPDIADGLYAFVSPDATETLSDAIDMLEFVRRTIEIPIGDVIRPISTEIRFDRETRRLTTVNTSRSVSELVSTHERHLNEGLAEIGRLLDDAMFQEKYHTGFYAAWGDIPPDLKVVVKPISKSFDFKCAAAKKQLSLLKSRAQAKIHRMYVTQ